MTYYEMLATLAQKGYDKIHVDLENKNIRICKQLVIENGTPIQNKVIVGEDVYECDELINEQLDIDELYKQYKYSLPSERDGKKHYFKALSADLLTDAQMVYGMSRLEARIRLEVYVMFAALKGWLTMTSPEHWFWQSEKDRDFVILEKWL